jgi:hypothetical protein
VVVAGPHRTGSQTQTLQPVPSQLSPLREAGPSSLSRPICRAELLPSMCKALGLVPSTAKTKQKAEIWSYPYPLGRRSCLVFLSFTFLLCATGPMLQVTGQVWSFLGHSLLCVPAQLLPWGLLGAPRWCYGGRDPAQHFAALCAFLLGTR